MARINFMHKHNRFVVYVTRGYIESQFAWGRRQGQISAACNHITIIQVGRLNEISSPM
jgi:hypothetical protein